MVDIKQTTITFSGVSKQERTMHIRTLGHREYFETMHIAAQVGAGSVVRVGNGIGSNIFTILKTMDFGTFELIAKRVLSGSVLEGVGAIEDPFKSDHFLKNTDEIYSATYAAVKALNPELFEKMNAEMGKTKKKDKPDVTVSAQKEEKDVPDKEEA